VAWRLIPVLALGYFCAALDRANVGMAALTMRHDLGFSNAVFGFGAGLFFVGYFLSGVPSNLILNKFGARRWMSRLLITWGIISGLTAFSWNAGSFYSIRFILGLAEGGFLPGVVLYLIWWFPAYYRSRMMAIFYSSGVIALIIGPPISGLLLQLNGALGLAGWQWLFVVEALPAVIMSVVTWQLLTERPTEAAWLRPEQRTWLAERVASEQAQREAIRKFSLAEAFYNPKVWLLSVAYFGVGVAFFGVVFFIPLIVQGLGVSTNMIGLVSAIPYVFALAVMLLWSWHSDLTGERTWHVASACLMTSAGLGACIIIGVGHPVVTMVALVFATSGPWALYGVFWSLPSALLTGAAAAGGIAMINAIGALGGWLGPWMFGLVKDATGSDNIALLCLSSATIVSAVLVLLAGHDRRMERMPSRM
jgi:ACS family tartrate transporter-like MFS transporter